MQFESSTIPGCIVVAPNLLADSRGVFAKTFHSTTFQHAGLESVFKEQFITESAEGVLRGMHFQVPPHEHAKIVTCVSGEVLDVVVDLRRGSPMYRKHQAFSLVGTGKRSLYIPLGLAHGFLVLKGPAILTYSTTTEHEPSADLGIHWDSFGFHWPIAAPVVSPRDTQLPPIAQFNSPF